MDKRIILLFVVGILYLNSISLTSAVQTEITQVNFDNGYAIEHSPQNFITQNKEFTINFFVYNTQNGTRVDNSSTYCLFYFTDDNGKLIYSKNSTYGSGYWNNTLSAGNFTKIGFYAWGLDCQNYVTNNQGGAIVDYFVVTYSGIALDESQSILYLSLFGIFIFIFVSIIFIINLLPSDNKRNEDGQIMSISWLKYLRPVLWFVEYMIFVTILYLSSSIAFTYLREQLLAKVLFTLYQITFMMTPIIVIVWLIWFFAKIFQDRQFQKIINRGIFPKPI